MKRWLACAVTGLTAGILVACGGAGYAPGGGSTPALAPLARMDGHIGPHTVQTPYPLPKQTPNWTFVEQPKPWAYNSTGPDRSKCGANEGLTYRVGPGQPYPQPHNVPWLRLLPCDTVLIYPSSQPYSDLIYIASRGLEGKAITISGVLDPKTGARPILDGSHAITSPNEGVDPYELCAGMLTVGLPSGTAVPNQAYGYKPGYLIIENFEIRNAFGKYPGSHQPVYTCTDTHGKPHPWAEFSAGLYINPAEHVLIKNNYLHNNGLGAFTNSTDGKYVQSRDFVVEDNIIKDNGNGEASLHNFYFELVGERVIHNYFGPPIKNTQGENIKDRSVCVEYSDNYIDNGNNLIAFRDPQSNGGYENTQKDAFGVPCVSQLYVHGNTFVSRGPTEFQGMSTVIGFGDGTIDVPQAWNRYGSVYFYNNVVIAIANRDNYGLKAATVFENGNQLHPTTFYGINNLFYSAPQSAGNEAPQFAACYWQQYVDFTDNWDSRKMLIKFATAPSSEEAVGTPCDGSGMGGITVSHEDPGFVDFANGNFHLTPSSPYYGLKAPLPQPVIQRHLLPDGIGYPTP